MALSAKIVRSVNYAAREASLRAPAHLKTRSRGGTAKDVVVSLTSYPPRIDMIWKTLETIYRQSVLPSAVVLVLSAEEFPTRVLPSSINRYKDQGLQIDFVEGNIRSYKKLIPAIVKFPGSVIVTADDDVLYPRHWLRDLVSAHKSKPSHIIGHRGTVIQLTAQDISPYATWPQAVTTSPSSHVFLTGLGGILYPPKSLATESTLNMDLAMELAPTADDIWFKAMAMLARTPVSKVSDATGDFLTIRSLQKFSLRSTNVGTGQNELQFKAVMDYFELWDYLT